MLNTFKYWLSLECIIWIFLKKNLCILDEMQWRFRRVSIWRTRGTLLRGRTRRLEGTAMTDEWNDEHFNGTWVHSSVELPVNGEITYLDDSLHEKIKCDAEAGLEFRHISSCPFVSSYKSNLGAYKFPGMWAQRAPFWREVHTVFGWMMWSAQCFIGWLARPRGGNTRRNQYCNRSPE